MNIDRFRKYFAEYKNESDIYSEKNQFLGVWSSGRDIFSNIGGYIANAKYEVNFTFYNWYTDTDPARIICVALKTAISKFIPTSTYPKFMIRFMFSEQIIQKGYVLKELKKAIAIYDLSTPFSTIFISINTYYGLGSYHFKYITIDGEYSLITGANVQNKFNFTEDSKEPNDNWHDIGIICRGEITTLINSHFTSLTDLPTLKREFNLPTLPILMLTNPANGTISNKYDDLYNFYNHTLNVGVLLSIIWAQTEIILIAPNLNDYLLFIALVDKIINSKINIKILTNYNFNHFIQEHLESGTNSNHLYYTLCLSNWKITN
jgi:hypothetical protein